jgi:uncharacterized 2Fe-2S/4Fe-4S cluster protein (DUF4445 family)
MIPALFRAGLTLYRAGGDKLLVITHRDIAAAGAAIAAIIAARKKTTKK